MPRNEGKKVKCPECDGMIDSRGLTNHRIHKHGYRKENIVVTKTMPEPEQKEPINQPEPVKEPELEPKPEPIKEKSPEPKPESKPEPKKELEVTPIPAGEKKPDKGKSFLDDLFDGWDDII